LCEEGKEKKGDGLVKFNFPSESEPSPEEEDKSALIVEGEGD